MLRYEPIYDITADAGVRVYASSLEELICKTLLATFNEITDIERVKPEQERVIHLRGKFPFLLADLINAVLLLHEREGFVASGCRVEELQDDAVKVRLFGEGFNPEHHTSKLVIKAATYHRLRLEKEGGQYVAEVIFDI
jgi:SHS2 domain-containing protein